MRLVTWNIQTARPNPDGSADVTRVVHHVAALEPDVVALQELDRGLRRSGGVDQARAMADGLDGTLVWGPTVRRGEGQYGIALVVRGPIARSWDVALGGTREKRVLVAAELHCDGRPWVVGCTHLSRRTRTAQQQLVVALDRLSAAPVARVLAGDLNLTPRHVLPWSTAAGYELVTGPPTHSTRRPVMTARIDHVLLSGAHVDAAAVHRFDVSDHAAVSVDLSQPVSATS